MVINEINLNPNHRTWAHVLGDAGYKLGYVGKHIGPICTAATASGARTHGIRRLLGGLFVQP